jgi:zinc D-Ala-D-Ala dipeptidase
VGDFLVIEFPESKSVRGISLHNGYAKSSDIYFKNSRIKDIDIGFSNGDSLEMTLTDTMGEQTFNRPVKAKWLRITIRSVYPGSKYTDADINEARVDAQQPAMFFNCRFQLLVLVAALAAVPVPSGADEMPQDFVYLRDIDPSIEQDMRYAGPGNFTGKTVPGYDAAECVLVRRAAEALKGVQADLKAKGLGLKVYDCYRPTQAVAAFVVWAKLPDDPEAKSVYYPNLDKAVLFPNYIATRSGHSRGATVDLTLVPLEKPSESQPAEAATQACTAPQASEAPDGSLAMGTTFDCFDGKSTLFASNITKEQNTNRVALRDAMQTRGFNDYAMEWWHFTLAKEPYPDTYFDFPVVARQ